METLQASLYFVGALAGMSAWYLALTERDVRRQAHRAINRARHARRVSGHGTWRGR